MGERSSSLFPFQFLAIVLLLWCHFNTWPTHLVVCYPIWLRHLNFHSNPFLSILVLSIFYDQTIAIIFLPTPLTNPEPQFIL
jgi:hypothetical protein